MNEARRWQALEMLRLMVSAAHSMMKLAAIMAQDVDPEVQAYISRTVMNLDAAEQMLKPKDDDDGTLTMAPLDDDGEGDE